MTAYHYLARPLAVAVRDRDGCKESDRGGDTLETQWREPVMAWPDNIHGLGTDRIKEVWRPNERMVNWNISVGESAAEERPAKDVPQIAAAQEWPAAFG